MPAAGLVRAAREQDATVTLEDALHTGDRVGPVPLPAGGTREMILRGVELCVEFRPAAGTEAPVVENAHQEVMMNEMNESPEPDDDDDNLPTEEEE